MNYKYKISIIIPFFNSECYLEEVIDSVINQTIGFENIQLILVNDGSTDNSEEICNKYKEKYSNILYLKKGNGGVSSARNKGLEYVEGKYVNFIDSDDIWEKDALLLMYAFMEQNYEHVDFVSARIRNFEANNDYHYLDYKFEKTRVINVEKEPDMLIFHVASSLFKNEIIKNMKFDTRLKIGEDCLFINSIVLNKLKYGVNREAVYNYRKRKVANSAIQNIFKSKSWYFDTPVYLWNELINKSNLKYNKIIKYIQYVLIYELKWRINCQYVILDYLEIKEHLRLIKDTINYIDNDVIESYRLLDTCEKKILSKIKEENRNKF